VAIWSIPTVLIPKTTARTSTVTVGQVNAKTPTITLVSPRIPRISRSSPSPSRAVTTLTAPPATSAMPTAIAKA
jgi:hypothetical protein